jgi:hypothetical protein
MNIFPNAKVIVDVSPEGRTGSAIVVAPNIQVLDQGCKGDGTFAWVRIQTITGPLNIGSIYAPAEQGRRMRFWRWLHSQALEENWVLTGDFNMLEFYDDSLGRSSVIQGAEERIWKLMVDELDLVDLYLCAAKRRGPLFTRQATCGQRTDAARLDCMYCSNRAE